MKDSEIDRIVARAAEASSGVDPALVGRIAESLSSSVRPVRPVAQAWLRTSCLFLICWAVASGGAAILGFHGIEKLDAAGIALIFPALGIFTWLAAATSVAETTPGSRRWIAPGVLLAAGSLGLLAVFALLFRDYRTDRFIAQGIVCLKAGLLHAVPTAIGTWLLLRRGFAVNPRSAGLAAGTLAGLAGVAMLELHCANLGAPHIMVWHTAVVVLSGIAGALVGWRGPKRDCVHARLGAE